MDGSELPSRPTTLASLAAWAAAAHRDRLALHAPGDGAALTITSYRELDDLSARWRDSCGDEIGPGQFVILSGRNSGAWIATFLGLLRAGAVPVPVDPEIDDESLQIILEQVEPAAVIADAGILERMTPASATGIPLTAAPPEARSPRPDATPDPGDLALILFSNGTTGTPRGVMLSHRNILANVESIIDAASLTDDDVLFSVLPLHHAFPLTVGTIAPLVAGVPIELESRPARVANRLPEARPTIILGVPALYETMLTRIRHQARQGARRVYLNAAHRLNTALVRWVGFNAGRTLFRPIQRTMGGRLRFAISGGAALPAEISRDAMAFGIPLLQGYGLSECAPTVAVQRFDSRKFWRSRYFWQHAGDVGNSLLGVTVHLVDAPEATDGAGEVVVEGDNVMLGYFRHPDLTASSIQDGRLHTGDLARRDSDGNLRITGRRRLTLKTPGGEMINLERIDRVLTSEPEIAQACAIVEHEPEWRLAVVVFPSTSISAASADEVRTAVRQAISRAQKELRVYERPRALHLTDSPLPQTRLGKIRRGNLPSEYHFELANWRPNARSFEEQP